MIKETLDVGAVEVHTPYGCILQLFHGAGYLIEIDRDNKTTVQKYVPATSSWVAVSWESVPSSLIGYVLRRAICRGIATSEVVEARSTVKINLGQDMLKHAGWETLKAQL